MAFIECRYDEDTHTYTDVATGELLQHVTGMMARDGIIDDRFFTEESSARGTAVHDLTAGYDLEALALEDIWGQYRPYLLAHDYAMTIAKKLGKAEILEVEQIHVHPRFRYACRLDRVERLYGAISVVEIKTGAEDESHGVQTALQAMACAEEYHLPPEAIRRWVLYEKPNGRARMRELKDRADFDRAREVIRRCC